MVLVPVLKKNQNDPGFTLVESLSSHGKKAKPKYTTLL
jgi:hypothetical protein